MGERGSALIETLIVAAVMGVVWAAAARVLADLPAQAAQWEDAAARRQAVRAIESRLARAARSAATMVFDVDGEAVEIPSVWPRRLGLWRPDDPGVVKADAMTVLTRPAVQRTLTLGEPLPASGGRVLAVPDAGCGAMAACGIVRGDAVLAVDRTGAVGLFRVTGVGQQLELDALMPSAAPVFALGSLLTPVIVDVFEFDAAEGALRAYDGYRSDNIVADGVASMAISYGAQAPMNDGPFVGSGGLAYDIDQRRVTAIELRVRVVTEHVLRWQVR